MMNYPALTFQKPATVLPVLVLGTTCTLSLSLTCRLYFGVHLPILDAVTRHPIVLAVQLSDLKNKQSISNNTCKHPYL
jgi:hypothetical protein